MTDRPQDGEAGSRPNVAVLMATFRDARFLPEQLASIRAQSYRNIDLWVSRDCEDEEMGRVLVEHAAAFGEERFHVLAGPRRGAGANFLSLVLDPEIEADYFAFSDQDDVWEPDKIALAVACLEGGPEDVPGLYCSRSRLIDRDGRVVGLTPFHGVRPPGFRNALVENIASGHTMVLNRAARELLLAAGAADVPLHDWWAYLLVAGAGGRVVYDPRPGARYRLHDRNLVGASMGFGARLLRWLGRTISGRNGLVRAANLRALHGARHLLTTENQLALETYRQGLEQPLPVRLRRIWGLGLYGQTRLGPLKVLAASLRKP